MLANSICLSRRHFSIIGIALTLCLFATSQLAAAELSISCGAVGKELELCRSGVEVWSQKTGHQVRIITAPASSTERLALYQQLLSAGSEDIDVFQIDVIWPGILGNHFIDLTPFAKDHLEPHFPALLDNNRVAGRLVALPWFASAGLLFYRQDLLTQYGAAIPTTWQDLTRIADQIQRAERAKGNLKFWGFVWQGRAYEGLTCNALEWIASYDGGTLLSADGTVTIDNAQAAAALSLAASWINTISPLGVLNYAEEEARGVFQSGNALFMRNWPYAWALAEAADSPINGKVAIAPLPRGNQRGKHAATLGGWQLAVSRYSRHPQLAAELVLFLTSAEQQRYRAIEAAYIPTRADLFQDKAILEANPFLGGLAGTLQQAISRPSSVAGVDYNRVSNRFWNTAHGILSGKHSTGPALRRLARDLKRIQGRHKR